MKRELEKLQKNIQSDTTGNITIPNELYTSLVNEHDKLTSLLLTVNKKIDDGLLHILQADWKLQDSILIWDQIDEFPIKEIGIEKPILEDMKKYLSFRKKGWEYTGNSEEKEILHTFNYKLQKKIRKEVKDNLYQSYDNFELLDMCKRKPRWLISVYPILKESSLNKFFREMDCTTQGEIIEKFSNTTLNIDQIRLLCKQEKIVKYSRKENNKRWENTYIAFITMDEWIKPLYIWPIWGGRFNWTHGDRLLKGAKLLLFTPVDIEEKEKIAENKA